MNSNKSGVKHFDRKFVASNLQSLLRCPKCAKSYTFLYNRSKNEESFRPILLPCGHNLCESCAWKNRKDLKCAECQTPAPPTIKVKDPSSQFAVNVRDYYELNFHVLGEASSLTYYRRFASETSNNSLSLSSGSEVIVQSTKCSECGNAVATGECRQCNAFYCRRCFEAVHNHSRVLKSHIFQKTPVEEQTQSSKGLRVGKDFFTLPSNDCNYHLMPRNLYCLNCKRTSCQICTSLQHRGHHIRQLAEINQRYASEIPVSLNSLNSTLLNIQNGKEITIVRQIFDLSPLAIYDMNLQFDNYYKSMRRCTRDTGQVDSQSTFAHWQCRLLNIELQLGLQSLSSWILRHHHCSCEDGDEVQEPPDSQMDGEQRTEPEIGDWSRVDWVRCVKCN